MCVLSRVWLFVIPWTVAHQAPPSVGFSRQENWSGLPFPTPGDLPNPGIELCLLCLLHWQADYLSLTTWMSVQSLSRVWLFATPWTAARQPSLSIHHQCPELAQTHVHRVSDAIQPSRPLWSPSPAFSLSQHQGIFQWVSSLHQVAKVLELQHQSF